MESNVKLAVTPAAAPATEKKKQGRNICILGPSGRGKTRSIMNLPPDRTIIFNWEKKALPFKNGNKFTQIMPNNIAEFYADLDRIPAGPKKDIIVLDSFSAFADKLKSEARIIKTGWDVWSYYDDMMYSFYAKIKKINLAGKQVFILAHDETIGDEEGGGGLKRIKVAGKAWEGTVEKEFDIVLWAQSTVISEGKIDYNFITQTNGKHPAKSPEGMFEYKIANDLNLVIKAIEDYDK